MGPGLLDMPCSTFAVVRAPLAALLFACASRLANSQTLDSSLWGADGKVLSIARSGRTIYIGGSFTSVGPASGGGVAVDDRDGDPRPHFPKVTGYVYAVVPDGSGGWYIGGDFRAVDGIPCNNLAHILGGGRVARWFPNPNGYVAALSLRSTRESRHKPRESVAEDALGRRFFPPRRRLPELVLYAGGGFTSAAGSARSHAAAFDGGSGGILGWDPSPDYDVESLCLGDSSVYIGGGFFQVGGVSRSYLAAVDAETGAVRGWNPSPDYWVLSLSVDAGVLYAGGEFTAMGGSARSRLAAIDCATGAVLAWDPHVTGLDTEIQSPKVNSVVSRSGAVYVAGNFTAVGGKARNGLAMVDGKTGVATDWNPGDLGVEGPFQPEVYCLSVTDRHVIVGGYFTSVGNVRRSYLAAIDTRRGSVLPWNPRPNSQCRALAEAADDIYVGGSFTSIWNWQPRNALAALDAESGRATAWDPHPNDYVSCLAVSGGTVFVSGAFTSIGGQDRYRLAAVDQTTGQATHWDPGTNGEVESMLVTDSLIYLGGSFTSMGGQPRDNLAVVDLASGALRSWGVGVNGTVSALAFGASQLYLGGSFWLIGGQPRNNLAALDMVTGLPTTWNPNADSWVNTLSASGATVYAGGVFHNVGGEPRIGLAGIDASTGNVSAWNPHAGGEVKAVVTAGGVVYAGGWFQSVGGESRNYLAAVDSASGAATRWDPSADNIVWSMCFRDETVYAGGAFGAAGGAPHPGLVGVGALRPTDLTIAAVQQTSEPIRRPIELGPNSPNPARYLTSIRFALATSQRVDLAVYDLEGRRVATVLDHELEAPGPHEALLRVAGWPPGCYLYRLTAGGASDTRKLFVVR